MSFTLSRYIGKHFFINICIAFAVVLAIAGLIDMVELVRRTANKDNIPFMLTMQIVIIRLPQLAEKLLPFAVMIGAMMTLMKLTRTNELVVARAAGLSVWRFLLPGIVIAILLGIVSIIMLNPLSAATIARYEQFESRYINGAQQVLSVDASGLWLRHVDSGSEYLNNIPIGSYIMQASNIQQSDMRLSDIIIFVQDDKQRFIGRIDADEALLDNGQWQLQNAVISILGKLPEVRRDYSIKTDLSIKQIQDSFAEPATLSFWELSGFIDTLEKAGFSALRHKLHWYSILITPLVFCAMILLAAVFSLRLPRRGRAFSMIFGAVLAGFMVNFVTGLFHAFGFSGGLPIELAVIAPYLLTIMGSVVMLLHTEDG
jgi:lipopolysaccharide export system permease protein